MPRTYPGFIFDRSRRSAQSRFSDDFVVCTDKEVGFVGRLYKVEKSRRAEYDRLATEQPDKYFCRVVGSTMCVLEIVSMTYEDKYIDSGRLRPLMRKAMTAYLFGEVQATGRGGNSYDEQIAAVEEVIRLALSQRPRLDEMNGATATTKFIDALQGAAESIKLLKSIANVKSN